MVRGLQQPPPEDSDDVASSGSGTGSSSSGLGSSGSVIDQLLKQKRAAGVRDSARSVAEQQPSITVARGSRFASMGWGPPREKAGGRAAGTSDGGGIAVRRERLDSSGSNASQLQAQILQLFAEAKGAKGARSGAG